MEPAGYLVNGSAIESAAPGARLTRRCWAEPPSIATATSSPSASRAAPANDSDTNSVPSRHGACLHAGQRPTASAKRTSIELSVERRTAHLFQNGAGDG